MADIVSMRKASREKVSPFLDKQEKKKYNAELLYILICAQHRLQQQNLVHKIFCFFNNIIFCY